MRLLFMTLAMSALGGCNYDRSFMSIDSDSGIPFLGLQMQVKSDHVPEGARSLPPVRFDSDGSGRWMTTSFTPATE